MQILLNDKNEITSYARVGSFDGGIDCTIPDSVLNDNPRSYCYIDGEFVKNTDYGKPTLSQAILDKSSEINSACENTIVSGVDYQSTAGLQHYSLTAYDQTNIMALGSEAKQGKSVPYHANGEICRFYTPTEFLGLVATVMYCITYNTTYANMLKHQVADMTNVDDVLAVQYGTPLNADYQAKLDEIMEALRNAETTA